MLKISRKLGRLAGVPCQHAFMIFLTRGGYIEGISNRLPWITENPHW
jgi:hypothetical protein